MTWPRVVFRAPLNAPRFFQNELENFPVATIQHCQAVMNACSYDSILALVCKESGQTKPDLHLFQCDVIKVTRSDWSSWRLQEHVSQ